MARILKDEAIPHEDAEDLLQETFFTLVFKWDNIRNPEAWLLSTLRNRCVSYWRRRGESRFEAVDAKILDILAGPQAPPQERSELRHDLNAALARLPEQERRVLRLRYGLGCESAEIAQTTRLRVRWHAPPHQPEHRPAHPRAAQVRLDPRKRPRLSPSAPPVPAGSPPPASSFPAPGRSFQPAPARPPALSRGEAEHYILNFLSSVTNRCYGPSVIDAAGPRSQRVQENEELVRLVVRARRLAGWYLRRQSIATEDAEDLIQQTLLALMLKHREVRNPDAWVIGTLRNKCRQYWRRRRDSPIDGLEDETLESALPPLPPDQELTDLRRDLEIALSRLPERCRQVLRYRYGLGFRATEIADLLKCPAANVRKTASRCLRTLQRELSMHRSD